MALELSKLRKSYLQLSKAKLTRKCHSFHLDAYGSKAELVDTLMKEHIKARYSPQPPSSSARKYSPRKSPTKRAPLFPPPSPRSNGVRYKLSSRSQSHEVGDMIPTKPKKPKSNRPKVKARRRARSKSMNSELWNPTVSELVDRRKKRQKSSNQIDGASTKATKPKKRRSSTTSMPTTKRKHDLLKMSKPELMRRCKIHRIDVNGLRSRREIVDRLWSVELLFQEKEKRQIRKSKKSRHYISAGNSPRAKMKDRVKRRKHNKRRGLLVRSKSENRGVPDPMESGQSIKLMAGNTGGTTLSDGGLSPLSDAEEEEEGFNSNDDDGGRDEVALWIDEECMFSKCLSRRRVIEALKLYSEHGQSEESINQIMELNPNLLSDWHHLLWIHLNQSAVDNSRCFAAIYQDIQRSHLLCDFSECCHYQRNQSEMDGDDEFMVNLLDTIHVHLIHCYDTGFRLRNVGGQTIEANAKGEELYFDHEMASFNDYYKAKRKGFERVRGERRVRCNKYFASSNEKATADLLERMLKEQSQQTEEKSIEVEDEEENCNQSTMANGTCSNDDGKDTEHPAMNGHVHSQFAIANGESALMPSTDNDKAESALTTAQILEMLQEVIDRFKPLGDYKNRICDFVENNGWNGLKLSRMSQKAFVAKLSAECCDGKAKSSLIRLFKALGFGNSGGSLSNSIQNCDREQILNILRYELLTKEEHGALQPYSEQIEAFFVEHQLNGKKLFEMKRKPFVQQLHAKCGGQKGPNSINHSLIVLYKAFFRMDLSEIQFLDDDDETESDHHQSVSNPSTPSPGDKAAVTVVTASNTVSETVADAMSQNELPSMASPHIEMKESDHDQSLLTPPMLARPGKTPPPNKKATLSRDGLELRNAQSLSLSDRRFWYWPSRCDERRYIRIPQRFDNLKEELLEYLNISSWDRVYNKALHLQNSHILKSMRCETDKYQSAYGVSVGSGLQLSHFLAMILYTDFTDLALIFTASFTTNTRDDVEHVESTLTRHSAFHHWARYLREMVECFGRKIKNSKTESFYRIVDDQYKMQSINARFHAPTSTTTQLTVARLFAPDNGIILELEPAPNGLELTYFHCGLFSRFSNEEERLFIGGARPLQIGGIRNLSQNADYRLFLTAITALDELLCSGRSTRSKRKSKRLSSTHYSSLKWCPILESLCRHRVSKQRRYSPQNDHYFRNQHPEYINGLFDSYCCSKKRVRLSLKSLSQWNEWNPSLKDLFIEDVELVPSPKMNGLTSSKDHSQSKDSKDSKQKRKASKRVRFAPEAMMEGKHRTVHSTDSQHSNFSKDSNSAKIDSKVKNARNRRRRHTVCGLEVPMELICGSLLFDLLPNVTVINVVTAIDGVGYDLVRGLSNLVIAHKLDSERRPLRMDQNARKQCLSMKDMVPHSTVLFVENAMYQYPVSNAFYIGLILRTLTYFFESKWFDHVERERNAIRDLSIIDAVIKWKQSISVQDGRTKMINPEIVEYFKGKKKIHFNLLRAKHCVEAAGCLLHSKVKRLPLYHVIAALFTECEVLTVYGVKVLSMEYLKEMLVSLQKLNRSKMKHCKLKRIILYQPIRMQCGDGEYEKMKQKFVRFNFKIDTKKVVEEKSQNMNMTVVIDRIVLPSR